MHLPQQTQHGEDWNENLNSPETDSLFELAQRCTCARKMYHDTKSTHCEIILKQLRNIYNGFFSPKKL